MVVNSWPFTYSQGIAFVDCNRIGQKQKSDSTLFTMMGKCRKQLASFQECGLGIGTEEGATRPPSLRLSPASQIFPRSAPRHVPISNNC